MSVFGVIQSECGKIRTRITPNTNIFHAVLAVDILRKNGHHRRLSGSWIHFCQFKIASFPVKWIKDDTCENWTFRISVSFKSYFSHWLTSFTVESVVLIWYYIFSSEKPILCTDGGLKLMNHDMYKQRGVMPYFSTRQNLLKKISGKRKYWHNHFRNLFDRSAEHK